jgi:hypothetical protein
MPVSNADQGSGLFQVCPELGTAEGESRGKSAGISVNEQLVLRDI